MNFFCITFGGSHIYLDLLEIKDEDDITIHGVSGAGKTISVQPQIDKTFVGVDDNGDLQYDISASEMAKDRLSKGALLIPITQDERAKFWDFIGVCQLLNQKPEEDEDDYEGIFPYYLSRTMVPNPDFERRGREPITWSGPIEGKPNHSGLLGRLFPKNAENPTDTILYKREADDIPLARYNCWTICRDILQHIIGVDIESLNKDFKTANRHFEATEAWGGLVSSNASYLGQNTARNSGYDYDWWDKIKILPMEGRVPALTYEHIPSLESLANQNWQLFNAKGKPLDNKSVSLLEFLGDMLPEKQITLEREPA
jgi:hypothetical protein